MSKDDLEALIQRATQGEIDAQVELAARYATGDGINKDLTRAVYWYEKAADESSEAKYNLALMHLFGEGTNKDEKKALTLLKDAADCGSPDACLVLGEAYETGSLGVEIEYLKAARYLLKAARLGSVNGIRRLGELIAQGKIGLIPLADLMRNFSLNE